MPRTGISLTTTVTTITDVKVEPRIRTMLKQRCEEHAGLARTIKDTKARQGRLKGEIDELFRKAGQGKALADGTSLDGYKLKMVCGKTKKFDQLGFMKAHGLSQADFDAFTEYEPNEPYIKVTAPGEKDTE